MSTTKVSARWTGEELKFIGTDGGGHQINLSKDEFRPAQLLLLGLAGCTGMDVVSILQKKRQKITSLEIQITGQQPDDYPKPFQVINVHFIVKGENIDPDAVGRAIGLSESKYCIVSQTLQHSPEIKTSYSVEN